MFQDTGGITTQIVGFATLTTSHCAFHGFTLLKEFHLDLYSCREFEKQKVIGFLMDALQITKIQVADLTEHCEWKD